MKLPPPTAAILQPKLIPVVLQLKDAYGIWQVYLNDFPKVNRFTLGSKIDAIFLDTIEFCFIASYANIQNKIPLIDKSISRVDLLKLLIQLSWEMRAIDPNKYVNLSEKLSSIGSMLGGWKRHLENKTPREIVSPSHGEKRD